MSVQEFYIDFEFTELRDVKDDILWSGEEKEEFLHLGIDKVYFSGEYPAILFKEVTDFSADILKQVARIQHLSWNYRKVLFLFVLSKTEIRIYNCAKRPFNYEAQEVDIAGELQKIEVARMGMRDIKALATLKQIFSRVAVDSGNLWNLENSFRGKISVQDRIDKYLVRSLLATAEELKVTGLSEETIHCLLMRSLFIMYLEDKGAASETSLYSDIMPGASSYLHILEGKEATYALFRKVEAHFNGHVFPLGKGEERQVTRAHLALIRRCLYDGNISGTTPSLFGDWRLFRFDILQIELLSEIYEHFLEEFKEKKKQEGGQYYTPPPLVELILNEKLPVRGETKWNHKIMDPACGSGIFLVEGFKRLVKRWKNANPGLPPQFADLCAILKENIFGIEIDRLAIRVTTFSLYLALLEHLNPRTLWLDRRYKFPYLINDPGDKALHGQGKNLFRRDTIGDTLPMSQIGKIDLLVGNPPFGSSISLLSIKEYCIRHKFGQDMVIPFLHKSLGLAPEGAIALIFNTKVLTNTEKPFQNFREWLFTETQVEKIYNFSIFRKTPKTFGGQLFSSAVGPVSILFYRKRINSDLHSPIEYWAPKSYVRNNLVEGVVIDATDIKFLPRSECENPTSKIWKVAMWGGLEDYNLLKRFGQFKSLSDFLRENSAHWGVGFRFLDNSTVTPILDKEIPKLPYIRPESIRRFYSSKEDFTDLASGMSDKSANIYRKRMNLAEHKPLKSINLFRRIGIDKTLYYGPHVLIKSGLSDNEVCASYMVENCSFNAKVSGLRTDSRDLMKAITALINSKLATYYLFLISSSIGIEREEINPHEVYGIPFVDHPDMVTQLSKLMDQIITAKSNSTFFETNISGLEKDINECIYKFYDLTSEDRILVEDFNELTTTILFEGHKSRALLSASPTENKFYAKVLTDQLNRFLSSGTVMVNAAVFEIRKGIPLNMVRLSFDPGPQEIEVFGSTLYETYLRNLNQHTLARYAKNIYIQKEIRYFDGNTIYIVKPNQKRFWSRSMAINDAKELIHEIMTMKQSERPV